MPDTGKEDLAAIVPRVAHQSISKFSQVVVHPWVEMSDLAQGGLLTSEATANAGSCPRTSRAPLRRTGKRLQSEPKRKGQRDNQDHLRDHEE